MTHRQANVLWISLKQAPCYPFQRKASLTLHGSRGSVCAILADLKTIRGVTTVAVAVVVTGVVGAIRCCAGAGFGFLKKVRCQCCIQSRWEEVQQRGGNCGRSTVAVGMHVQRHREWFGGTPVARPPTTVLLVRCVPMPTISKQFRQERVVSGHR